ncbi:hypothetical protein BO70DRAFT_101800 [Aspergillus heteromorphus CBS 117.55]|uniref:Uncharacterized protein n=1 Tax=Aspergillus heteromorphus CBS 117.55 TaxID=1448321 RepID=A0A317VQ02_9EURO|nr:uncharacterized protein BO70DRAFT_101800 [Aspergillus heteromorphus CBS 117.55]PWY75127.1 hypothetical protein BO70DRAFT_101800 [Aspergillus heteromorphus CBS 117.55]
MFPRPVSTPATPYALNDQGHGGCSTLTMNLPNGHQNRDSSLGKMGCRKIRAGQAMVHVPAYPKSPSFPQSLKDLSDDRE